MKAHVRTVLSLSSMPIYNSALLSDMYTHPFACMRTTCEVVSSSLKNIVVSEFRQRHCYPFVVIERVVLYIIHKVSFSMSSKPVNPKRTRTTKINATEDIQCLHLERHCIFGIPCSSNQFSKRSRRDRRIGTACSQSKH
jgi:hypothetical protein